MALARSPAAAGALAAALFLIFPGCGTQDEAADVGEAVVALVTSGDCVRLLDVTSSVQRALSGVVGTDLAAASTFLAGVAERAPERVAPDLRALASAAGALASAEPGDAPAPAHLDAEGTRAAAERVAAWARGRCPA